MAEPFLAEIKMYGFNFAPRNWAMCDGQILPINQNQSLYSLLGTTYGGDGRTTFGLPDLRGRTPVHVGDGYRQGQRGGTEAVSLSAGEIPNHNHQASASSDSADTPIAAGNALASTNNLYHDPTNTVNLHTGTIANVGGGQGHQNMQPFLTINFAIALRGLFPSRS